MCLLTDTFTRIHLLVTETPIFRCLMCFALCGKFAQQSSHEHSVMICPSARWDWYGQVATRARWTGLARVQGPMPRAWSQGVQTRTAGRETGETSPLRFGMWIARCIWFANLSKQQEFQDIFFKKKVFFCKSMFFLTGSTFFRVFEALGTLPLILIYVFNYYVILCCVLGLEARFWSQRMHAHTMAASTNQSTW